MDDLNQERADIPRLSGGELPDEPTEQALSDDLDDDQEEWQDFDPNADKDEDDQRWDVFLHDETEDDPLPEYGDFWPPDDDWGTFYHVPTEDGEYD